MKAGMELDALIATKVMGWKLSQATDTEEYWDNGSFCNGVWIKDWNPSTNIADAWLVVEKFEQYQVGKGITQPYCLIWHDGREYGEFAETAPLAICMASLKAVGVEVDGV